METYHGTKSFTEICEPKNPHVTFSTGRYTKPKVNSSKATKKTYMDYLLQELVPLTKQMFIYIACRGGPCINKAIIHCKILGCRTRGVKRLAL